MRKAWRRIMRKVRTGGTVMRSRAHQAKKSTRQNLRISFAARSLSLLSTQQSRQPPPPFPPPPSPSRATPLLLLLLHPLILLPPPSHRLPPSPLPQLLQQKRKQDLRSSTALSTRNTQQQLAKASRANRQRSTSQMRQLGRYMRESWIFLEQT